MKLKKLSKLKAPPSKSKQAKNFMAALLGLPQAYFKMRLQSAKKDKNQIKDKIDRLGYQ